MGLWFHGFTAEEESGNSLSVQKLAALGRQNVRNGEVQFQKTARSLGFHLCNLTSNL